MNRCLTIGGFIVGALGAACVAGLRGVKADAAGRTQAAQVAIALPAAPPAGAVALFTGSQDQITNNFVERYSTNPAKWSVDASGVASNNRHDISSKQEFGDCFLHAEFKCPADANGNKIGHGNSGVGFEGRYEVQILASYGDQPSPEGCGAFYSQIPPIVNASKPAGQWQAYDIVFRAPRFDADGKVVEKARATVFQNGILVQNNQEFNGPTGIQYGEFKGEAKTGPVILQGDHDNVQFRNVWVIPEP